MPIRKVSLLRLIPLASLVLAACTTTKPTGPATSPTSPQWHAHEQAVQQLSTYQTRGSFAYLSDQKKSTPASSGSSSRRSATVCC